MDNQLEFEKALPVSIFIFKSKDVSFYIFFNSMANFISKN